ncbi:MAG: YfiR family protein [Syntrophales bacterium]|nr:YfiR family protein [Syntrophales bacterium]
MIKTVSIKGMSFVWFIALAFILSTATSRSTEKTVPEYKLKAAVMFNILKFVRWPADVNPGSMVYIGILGKDPFGEHAEELINKTLERRPLAIIRSQRLQDLKHCHAIFIARSEVKRIKEIISSPMTRKKIILGDSEGLAKEGVMFNLLVREQKIHIEINHEQAKREGISISPQLLAIGVVVKP